MTKFLVMAAWSLLASAGMANEMDSPLGNWKTISDKTGKVESVIQIYQEGSEFKAKIVSVFDAPEPNCTKCHGDLKDKPLVGLVIMKGLKQDGSEWNGGRIVDPNDGEEYKVKMELADSGHKLKVRGFIGISLFGRTQTWVRDH
jgi:uncharacterized protein (DUF2147 family)